MRNSLITRYAIVIIFVFLFCIKTHSSFSQSLGIEYGIGAGDIMSTSPDYSIAFSLPLTSHFMANCTYTHWNRENSASFCIPPDTQLSYNGSKNGHYAYNFSLYYRLVDKNKLSFYVGQGFGQYQSIHLDKPGDSGDTRFLSAYTISVFLKYNMTKTIHLYSRVFSSFHNASLLFDWGFFNVGAEIKLFD